MVAKLKSMKFLVTIWAMGIVTYIVVKNNDAFLDVAKYLCAVPVAYIGANVLQKKILNHENVNNTTEARS
jgi:hypothetical protein